MADQIEFPEGLFAYKPRENAPNFVKCNISIDRERFIKFLQSKSDEFVNLDVQEAKSTGKWYAKVNNWVPAPQQSAPVNDRPAPAKDDFDKDVPF